MDTPLSPQRMRLRSTNVWIDPPGRFEPRVVVIEHDKIIAVEPFDPASAFGGGAEIDLGDRYLLPGLINTHVHLEFSASPRPLQEFASESQSERLSRARRNAKTLLMSGVTTARDCGSTPALLALANMRHPDVPDMPRLLMAGPPITPRRGHLHMMGGEVETLADIDHLLNSSVGLGARSVKLMGSGGGMTPGSIPEAPSFSQDVFDHVAKFARRRGLPSVVHVLAPESIRRAALARFDSLEHCAFFERGDDGRLVRNYDDDLARLVAASKVSVMPNLSTATRAHDRLREEGGAEATHQLAEFEVMLDNFAKLVRLGIPMVCGTDAGVRDTPFEDTWLELVWMRRAGMSAVEAIRTATTGAAHALRLDDAIGRVVPGYAADLIVLDADPIADAAAFASPTWVIAGGWPVLSPHTPSATQEQYA